MSKIIAIIQVRLDSSRFPKKALSQLIDKPMIIHVIDRAKQSKHIDQLVVATSTRKIDDPIIDVVSKQGISVFRGSADDVLDRYYKAAKKYHADIIVRITGDCPLIDPVIIDKVIQCYIDGKYDYVSNTIDQTYPDGLDTEVFSYKALEKTWKEAKLLSEREHVTPYIVNHPEKFKLINVRNDVDLSHMRWTVDYEKDLEYVKEIYGRLYKKDSIFLMDDILQLLEKNPELNKINIGITRNEGYLRSLDKDKIIKK